MKVCARLLEQYVGGGVGVDLMADCREVQADACQSRTQTIMEIAP